MNREKHNLLAYITQVSFAMDDTVLFLDTHPCDKEALCYYEQLIRKKRCCKRIYAKIRTSLKI